MTFLKLIAVTATRRAPHLAGFAARAASSSVAKPTQLNTGKYTKPNDGDQELLSSIRRGDSPLSRGSVGLSHPEKTIDRLAYSHHVNVDMFKLFE